MCPYGVAKELKFFGLFDPDISFCVPNDPLSGIDSYVESCEISKNEGIQKYFQTNCFGKKLCEGSFNATMFPLLPLSCHQSKHEFLFVAFCDVQNIDFPGLNVSVSRTSLSVLVVVIDLLVCFIFIVYIFTQFAGIDRDAALSD